MKPTLVLRAKELHRHARSIADAIARDHAHGCCVVRGPIPNPTLVSHGLVKQSRWHIVEPPRGAIADLYVGTQAEAARVTRLLANLLSRDGKAVTLHLLDNAATPGELAGHPRSSIASSNPRGRSYASREYRRVTRRERKHKGRSTAETHYLEDRRLAKIGKRIAALRQINPAHYDVVEGPAYEGRHTGRVRQFIATGKNGAIYGCMLYADGRFVWMNVGRRSTSVPAELARTSPLDLVRKGNPSRSPAARARRRGYRSAIGGSRKIARAVAAFQQAPKGSRARAGSLAKYRYYQHAQASRAKGPGHGRRANPKRPVDQPWRHTFEDWYATRQSGPFALDLFEAARIWEDSVTRAITSPTTSALVSPAVRSVYSKFRDPGKPMGRKSNPAPEYTPMRIGTRFTLYGWANRGGRLEGWGTVREKTATASRVISQTATLETWPNTAAGARAANAWSLRMNVAEWKRVRPNPRGSQSAGPRGTLVVVGARGAKRLELRAPGTVPGWGMLGREMSRRLGDPWTVVRSEVLAVGPAKSGVWNPRASNPARSTMATLKRKAARRGSNRKTHRADAAGARAKARHYAASSIRRKLGHKAALSHSHLHGPGTSRVGRAASRPRNPRGKGVGSPRQGNDRDFAIATIRAALKRRSKKAWSVTGGRGTVWGWIYITAPPARRTWMDRPRPGFTENTARTRADWEAYDSGVAGRDMSPADHAELARLLDIPLSDVSRSSGVSIPGGNDYYDEYMDRAEGRKPERLGKPYWDNPRGNPQRRTRTGARGRATAPRRRSRARAQHPARTRRPNPATTTEAAKVVRMFEDRGPIKVKTARVTAPKPLSGAVAKIGDLVAVVYRSKKFDGKSKDYEHEFGTPRPLLVADPATGDLNVVRGQSDYHLTPDGIVK